MVVETHTVRAQGPRPRLHDARRHIGAAAVFAVASVALTWPLAARLSTHIPGTAPDDNVVFLWNVWWMREAWSTGLSGFFHTPYMFHPGGVDLVLHTTAALDAFAGATLFGSASLPGALNLTILAGCALNGFAAYLLAWQASRHAWASILAGIVFAASPGLVGHLTGRFSSYTAWPLAFFAYALIETLRGQRIAIAAVAGALLAAVAYNDYYYFIYACAFLACALADRWLGLGVRIAPARIPVSRLDHLFIGVALAAAVAAILIAITGGTVLTLGSMRVSLTRGANLRAVAAGATLIWLWRRRRPMLTTAVAWSRIWPDALRLAVMLGVCALLMAPLLEAAWTAVRSGQYVSQIYFWRTAPSGVDVGTLALGNPFNGLWGSIVMRVYGALGIWGFDGPLWLGVVPLVLIATRSAWRQHPQARLWLIVVAVFVLWALGPYLLVFGIDTGLPMPFTLLRFVPVAANARIPGHAVVFVYLGAAVLLAMAIASSRAFRPPWRLAALAMLMSIDFWAAPLPMHQLERPPIYAQLAAMPDGAVLDIPLGIRDGFGEEGRIDTSSLYYQTIHRKPVVGGYIGRLPPAVRARYRTPVFDALLKLSAGNTAHVPAVVGANAARALKEANVRYIVVDTRLATTAVRDFVMSMPLRLVASDEVRRVYEID
jgi:hypothetical protein